MLQQYRLCLGLVIANITSSANVQTDYHDYEEGEEEEE